MDVLKIIGHTRDGGMLDSSIYTLIICYFIKSRLLWYGTDTQDY